MVVAVFGAKMFLVTVLLVEFESFPKRHKKKELFRFLLTNLQSKVSRIGFLNSFSRQRDIPSLKTSL